MPGLSLVNVALSLTAVWLHVGVSGCVVDIAGVHKRYSDPTVKNGTQQNKANLNMY